MDSHWPTLSTIWNKEISKTRGKNYITYMPLTVVTGYCGLMMQISKILAGGFSTCTLRFLWRTNNLNNSVADGFLVQTLDGKNNYNILWYRLALWVVEIARSSTQNNLFCISTLNKIKTVTNEQKNNMKGYMFFNVIASLKTLITTALQLGVMYL